MSGEKNDVSLVNKRFGGTLVYPLNRRHGLKLVYIRSLSTRLGADFDKLGLYWQVRWGGGM